jgi:hypothetical protein
MRRRATMVSRDGFDLKPRHVVKNILRSRSVARNGTERRPELQHPPERGVACLFGATCVGVLLERMRLHLATQRFLAERRGDRIWEASCDYAALSLERIGARLRPGMFEQPLFPKMVARGGWPHDNAREKPRVPRRNAAGKTRVPVSGVRWTPPGSRNRTTKAARGGR